MIEFDCPYCESALRVANTNGTKHAWCRKCRRIVVVPGAGVSQGEECSVSAAALPSQRFAHPPAERAEARSRAVPKRADAGADGRDGATEKKIADLTECLEQVLARADATALEIERLTQELETERAARAALEERIDVVGEPKSLIAPASADSAGSETDEGDESQGMAFEWPSDAPGNRVFVPEVVTEQSRRAEAAMLESFLRFTRGD